MSEVTELGNAGREGRPYLHACRDRSCVMPVLFLIYETLEQSTYDNLSVLDNFACFLSFANVFYSKSIFRKDYFRNTIRVSNSLGPDQLWVQTVCKILQTTLVNKKLDTFLDSRRGVIWAVLVYGQIFCT